LEQTDTSVTAAVCLSGYSGSLDGRVSSSPLAHVRTDAPPFLVAHGDKDTIVLRFETVVDAIEAFAAWARPHRAARQA
jgi:hypothetical protein